MNPTTLNALAAFPDQLDAHFNAIPGPLQHWRPPSWEGIPSEALTALEQVCHVRDIEIEGYHVRFARTLRENHPTLTSLDTDALARDRGYGNDDADAALAAFRVARIKTMALLASVESPQWDRTATFEGYGQVTLQSLVHYLCSHDQQHLAGLQWLLGQMSAHGAATGR